MRFPFGGLSSIRGFLFADAGAAWFSDGTFFDPEGELVLFRTEPRFRFWDSENNRLQDGRASYGVGFQFFFLGLQLNWSWAKPLPYTRLQQSQDPNVPGGIAFVPVKVEPSGSRMDFYIVYDF
jgi:outer membrane protein assembly factor BamA